MNLLILACMVLATAVTNVRSSVPATFYPYGTGNGDSIAPVNDDGATSIINLAGVYPFFATSYTSLYVNTNGLLSFAGMVSTYTPNPFPIQSFPVVAPFWSDVDTRMNNGRVYYRETTDASILARANQDVTNSFPPSCLTSFNAQYVFIATWDAVTYFGGSMSTSLDTFQCVLITDGTHTFAIFNYGDIAWTTGTASGGLPATGLGGIPAQVGFNAGDNVNYFAVPGSRTPAIVNIASTTNVGITGRYMFRIDQASISLYGCDACRSSPCLNCGVCTNVGVNSFTCTCPPGYTGPICETDIDECSSHPCQNNGICVDEVNRFHCTCPAGFFGTFCEININECSSNPCQNNAICNDLVNGFSCSCPPGYTGRLCEIDIDECSSNPCQNNGVCVDGVACFSCSCPPGYTGFYCEININECHSYPCQNHAICVDQVNGFSCSCQPGYTGRLCETDIDECSSHPCQNNGICNDGVNQFCCTCPPGYAGVLCEININECSSYPCQNNGICHDGVNQFTCSCPPGYTGTFCEIDINECSSSPCQNGGSCDDEVNYFSCCCAPGYTGTFCQININECNSHPCQNNGVCTDGVNRFSCTCQPGYTGVFCETDINECSSQPCQHGGHCVDGVNSFSCSCLPGYTGTLCEIDIDECSSHPCQNNGICIDGVNRYTCTCPGGYFGSCCELRYDCLINNPCTKTNSLARLFYFPNTDPHYYVQCSEWGQCFTRPCADHLVWDPVANTCNYAPGSPGYVSQATNAVSSSTSAPSGSSTGGYNCGNNNPCTPANIAARKFYFPYPDPGQFVQCSERGQCFIMPCPAGMVWNSDINTCINPIGRKRRHVRMDRSI